MLSPPDILKALEVREGEIEEALASLRREVIRWEWELGNTRKAMRVIRAERSARSMPAQEKAR